MIIAGLDVSPTSTGCIKFELDSQFNIVKIEKLGFCEIAQTSKNAWKDVITYKDGQFSTYYHRQSFMLPKIMDFLKDAEYIALEDYAFSAKGKITMLAEVCGNIKSRLFDDGKKIRAYDPGSVKLYATGKGNAKKPDMFDSYQALSYKEDFSYLPQIKVHKKGAKAGQRNKDGISPTSDLIDAFFICDMLRHELWLKSVPAALGLVTNNCKRVMTRTTKVTKVDILNQTFIFK